MAVSGGSDSYALLHLLSAAGNLQICAATVDHKLRKTSAEEAQGVATQCAKLGVDHTILEWSPNGRSSDAARIGRYQLLADHAESVGATAIALGHTIDDQAETVFMRAQRLSQKSGTRGLSGMSQVTTYHNIKLVRPLLMTSRQELRSYLKNLGQDWIDDPSNVDSRSERVRIRNALNNNPNIPKAQSIARLADLSSAGRRWLSDLSAKVIDEHSCINPAGDIVLNNCAHLPSAVLAEVFSTLVLVAGGQSYRTAIYKLHDVVSECREIRPLRKTIGNTVINVKKGSVSFSKEVRDQPQHAQANANTRKSFSILALERFRSSDDDAQFEAVVRLLENIPVQHKARN